MKLKYYLRGLGIGIVVTAIIMSFTRKTEELTDAEIKLRAAQLGMVEKSVLADIQKENEFSGETVKNEENVPEKENELIAENTQDTVESEDGIEETVADEETESESAEESTSDISSENQETENNAEDVQINENIENYIVISIQNGNGSEVISQRLFEAGLVHSAAEYNRYLINNGYDRKLRVGNHEIPVGATEEEMAKILCGMK